MKNIYLGLKNFERGFMKYGLGGKMLAYPRITFYWQQRLLQHCLSPLYLSCRFSWLRERRLLSSSARCRPPPSKQGAPERRGDRNAQQQHVDSTTALPTGCGA